MANLIQIVTRWKDEGATAGLRNMSAQMNILTNAIGVGAGVGAISSVNVLARRLGELARAPLEAADSFGQLATRINAGTVGFDKNKDAVAFAREEYQRILNIVGADGVKKFEDLAAAQKKADDAFKNFGIRMAAQSAPMRQLMAEVGEAVVFLGRFAGASANLIDGMQKLEAELAREANINRVAGRPQMFPSHGPSAAQSQNLPAPTPGQLAYGEWLKSVKDETNKIAEAEQKRLLTLQDQVVQAQSMMGILEAQGKLFGPEVDPALAAREAFDRQMDEVFMQGRMIGPETLLESLRLTYPEITQLASDAGNSVANSLVWIASNFNNKMMTIGSAAKAFWNALVADILASLARLGLASLGTFLIGLGIGGPAGAFVSAAGAAMGGKGPGVKRAGRGRSEGGDTYIFQGLNTRDMFMEVGLRSGSLARANDLVLMRSEAG